MCGSVPFRECITTTSRQCCLLTHLQPLALSINKAAKDLQRDKFRYWCNDSLQNKPENEVVLADTQAGSTKSWELNGWLSFMIMSTASHYTPWCTWHCTGDDGRLEGFVGAFTMQHKYCSLFATWDMDFLAVGPLPL